MEPNSTKYVIVTLGAESRVTDIEFYFALGQVSAAYVDRAHGRALVTPELPSDAVVVHTQVMRVDSGCVDSEFYASTLLSRVLGNVLIRVQYTSDGFPGPNGPFELAEIRTVPADRPCLIE